MLKKCWKPIDLCIQNYLFWKLMEFTVNASVDHINMLIYAYTVYCFIISVNNPI